MFNTIRKNHQTLMLFIVILTIAGFAAMYIRANPTKFGSNDIFSIYGKVVERSEIDTQVSCYRLALALGLTDYVRDMGGLGEDENAALNNYILNQLIIQHQAPALGIRPTDDDVATAIKSLTPLQTDGAFDPAKYATFVQEQLGPRGLTERQLEDVVRDSLRVQQLRRIITSPVAIGEGELRTAARIYQPVSGQVLHFDREKFMTNVSVTPEEISLFYEKNKTGLKKKEERSISYVVLELPAEQQKLTGKERGDALQKLADQAVEVGKRLRDGIAQGSDFTALAGKESLHPEKVTSLQRDGSQEGKDSGLPDSVVSGAFRFQKTGEISDPIQDGNSFYLLTLDTVSPTRQLELSEVTDKITKYLKSEKANTAAEEAATKSLAQIRAAMTSGKSFAEAVKQAGVKADPLVNIDPSNPKNTDEQQALAAATLSLKEGELGQLEPAPWGAFAIYLEKRAPLTDAQWKEHQPELSKKMLTKDQDLIFLEWLRQSAATAEIKMLAGAVAKSGS